MIKFIFVVVFTALLTCFFMQEPLTIYAEQKYQKDINITKNLASKKAIEFYDFLKFAFKNRDIDEKPIIIQDKNITIISQNLNKSDKNATKNIEISLQIDENLTKTIGKINLKSGDEILFIGDSIMQSIAMNAKKILAKRGIKIIDMSKHSTGLVNKKYYDWQSVSEQFLNNNQNVRLIVALFGANDSWGRTIGGKYREFESDEWGEFYAKRVSEIYKVAQKRDIPILWLGAPCMKKSDFNLKMERLNEIFKASSKNYKQNFININEIICLNDNYVTHINNDKNESVKVRANDGIHLSVEGGKKVVIRMLDELKIDEKAKN